MYSSTWASTGVPFSSKGVNFQPSTSAFKSGQRGRTFFVAVRLGRKDVAFGGNNEREMKLIESAGDSFVGDGAAVRLYLVITGYLVLKRRTRWCFLGQLEGWTEDGEHKNAEGADHRRVLENNRFQVGAACSFQV